MRAEEMDELIFSSGSGMAADAGGIMAALSFMGVVILIARNIANLEELPKSSVTAPPTSEPVN
jgi:hypothetical protein